jgi:hypothetical protein
VTDDNANGEHGVRCRSDGYRVLALDTDVEQQGLTRLLLGRAITVDGADSTAEG